METRVQQVRSNPDDIELVREVSLRQVSDWLLSFVGEGPHPLVDRIRDLRRLKSTSHPS